MDIENDNQRQSKQLQLDLLISGNTGTVPLQTHHSPQTTHHNPPTTHHSPPKTHSIPLEACQSPPKAHCTSRSMLL